MSVRLCVCVDRQGDTSLSKVAVCCSTESNIFSPSPFSPSSLFLSSLFLYSLTLVNMVTSHLQHTKSYHHFIFRFSIQCKCTHCWNDDWTWTSMEARQVASRTFNWPPTEGPLMNWPWTQGHPRGVSFHRCCSLSMLIRWRFKETIWAFSSLFRWG